MLSGLHTFWNVYIQTSGGDKDLSPAMAVYAEVSKEAYSFGKRGLFTLAYLSPAMAVVVGRSLLP